MNNCPIKICIILLSTILLASCKQKAQLIHADTFDKILYSPSYASGFEIKGAEGKKSSLITITNPWQGADSVTTHLLILRGGESAPENFDGQVIEGDAKRVVAMSSTQIAMLDAIGAVGTVVGVSGIDFVTNPDIQSRRKTVGDVGFEGNVNYELLLSLNPDIVLLYGVNGASSMEGKLKELGIAFMYVGDYLEESPLGKAEWMVALAEMTGRRAKGEKVYDSIPKRYNALKEKVTSAGLKSPSVIINAPYNGSWFMPPEQSYAVRLIHDAGGYFVYQNNTGNNSVPIDLEEAYMLVNQADIWINVGNASSLSDLNKLAPKFADCPAIRNGRIYNNTLRINAAGGNDYFESAVVNPDIVLRDLVKIFHPDLVDDDFIYYKQLK